MQKIQITNKVSGEVSFEEASESNLHFMQYLGKEYEIKLVDAEREQSYRKVLAHAQAMANLTGLEQGIYLSNGEYRTCALPRPENRSGFELRCEIVRPSI